MRLRERVVVYVTRPSNAGGLDVLTFKGPDNVRVQAPAGGVEAGETAEAAAIREVTEETGVTITGAARLTSTLWRYSGADCWCLQHFLRANAPKGLRDVWRHTVRCEGPENGQRVMCGWTHARHLDRLAGGQGNAASYLMPPAPPRPRRDVAIRLATELDWQQINDLRNHHIRTSTAIYTDVPLDQEAAAQMFGNRDASRHPIIVAELEGVFAGYAMLSRHDEKCGYSSVAEDSVYVADAAQGRGVGTALLSDLLERGRRGGLHSVLARVDSEQLASLGLHLKFDFGPVGVLREVGVKYGRRLDVVLLQKMLEREDHRLHRGGERADTTKSG